MAIQLNDRDHLIFKLIDEHQVLLEKHISWFISNDEKPVLIRDRLRKLFYLDFLLCHRHGSKLPWWTTPTKPLVYLMSPMARTHSGFPQHELDLFDTEVQRHWLEVANIRMIHLIAQKDGEISQFSWLTLKPDQSGKKTADAKVSFTSSGNLHKMAIANHPTLNDSLMQDWSIALQDKDVGKLLVISRDEAHQRSLQKLTVNSSIASCCFFTTHHDLYRSGVVRSLWQTAQQSRIDLFGAKDQSQNWTGLFNAPVISEAVA